jgi:hypothetical protein
MLFNKVVCRARDFQDAHPSWRWGQCLFNALTEVDVTLAGKIQGGVDDPFYDDALIDRFYIRLLKRG